ncbi:MAG: carbon dioxide concentrating mechanism protein CcmL [Pirellulaceae bacterium]|nr:MAG: carbon dioxide concentrating mechanism protein CcmL [Pirellulaceae bacterium]
MRIAQVIGTVTLSQAHLSFGGATLKLVLPLGWPQLSGAAPDSDSLVAWDDLGAGVGQWIAISEGAEAAQPFFPERKPVDCYNAALLDDVRIEPYENRE